MILCLRLPYRKSIYLGKFVIILLSSSSCSKTCSHDVIEEASCHLFTINIALVTKFQLLENPKNDSLYAHLIVSCKSLSPKIYYRPLFNVTECLCKLLPGKSRKSLGAKKKKKNQRRGKEQKTMAA